MSSPVPRRPVAPRRSRRTFADERHRGPAPPVKFSTPVTKSFSPPADHRRWPRRRRHRTSTPAVRARVGDESIPAAAREGVAGVGARALEHRVVAALAVELIRALAVVQEVVARAPPEEVAVRLAVEHVGAALAKEVVDAGAPVDAIRVGVADQEVAPWPPVMSSTSARTLSPSPALAVVGDVVEVDVDRRQARGIEDVVARAEPRRSCRRRRSAVERVVAVTAEEPVVAAERRAACRCRRRRSGCCRAAADERVGAGPAGHPLDVGADVVGPPSRLEPSSATLLIVILSFSVRAA